MLPSFITLKFQAAKSTWLPNRMTDYLASRGHIILFVTIVYYTKRPYAKCPILRKMLLLFLLSGIEPKLGQNLQLSFFELFNSVALINQYRKTPHTYLYRNMDKLMKG